MSTNKLSIDRLITIQGTLCNGFFVRNSQGKVLAIGAIATATNPGFCLMKAKRYSRDLDLCRAIAKLTNVPLKSGVNPFAEVN